MDHKFQANKLCNASASGDLSQVESLLKDGADVNGFNVYNRTALQVAKLGNPAVVEALLEAGANPNVRDPVLGLTVTHDTARAGFDGTLGVLVRHGADVNLADALGNLPLHLAAREGHLSAVRLLIGHTDDPLARNADGDTAGQLARKKRKVDTADFIDNYVSSAKRRMSTRTSGPLLES